MYSVISDDFFMDPLSYSAPITISFVVCCMGVFIGTLVWKVKSKSEFILLSK